MTTSVPEDSYTYPGTGLTIWRDEDSKLYIKDTNADFISENSFYFRKSGDSKVFKKRIENKPMKLTLQGAIYVGAVYRHTKDRKLLFIFDASPNTESTNEYLIKYVKNQNFEIRNAVNVYISYPDLLRSFREYPQRDGLSIIIHDGGNESIQCFSMDEAESRVEIFEISAVIIGQTLTIDFTQQDGFSFFSSEPREFSENRETFSVVFNYEADDIYIGTFGYQNGESYFRADFFLGLTEDNFYINFKRSREATIKNVETTKMIQSKQHGTYKLFVQ